MVKLIAMPARNSHRAGMIEPKEIPLTNGGFALVSAEDYEMVSQYNWFVTENGYVRRSDERDGCVYLHRFVNQTPPGFQTDHWDKNRLNNTRENLRTADQFQNGANRKKATNTASQFKGVCMGRNGAWRAYVCSKGNRYDLGSYVSEQDAAFAYNLRAKELFGELASLNDLPLDYLATNSEPTRFTVNKSSRFIGVSLIKSSGYWSATLTKGVKGSKVVYRSHHKTQEQAAIAYNALAALHHGPSARLNPL